MIYLEAISCNSMPMISCSTEEEWNIIVNATIDIVLTNNIRGLNGAVLNPFAHLRCKGAVGIEPEVYHSLMNVLSIFEIKMIPAWDISRNTWFQHLDKHGVKYYRGDVT